MKEHHRTHFPLQPMCKVFNVSRSGYYDWVKRQSSVCSQEHERLKVAIHAAHKRSREAYGTRRLKVELEKDGFCIGRDRLGRMRQELGVVCKQKKVFKKTTDSNHTLPVAPNLLNQNFSVARPNQVWLTDITYIHTQEGWLYLAAIKDLFSCEIVGYAMGERMTQELVCQALFRAVQHHQPSTGLIHHSDRGSQYCSQAYQKLLKQFGMTVSMSRKGNCYDNSPMESFWGSLKNELVHHQSFATRLHARAAIQEWIEIFYNRIRFHSRLGYLPPAIFVKQFYQQKLCA